ncbi:MAG: amino acid transport protein [Bdellovibrionota bacterium]
MSIFFSTTGFIYFRYGKKHQQFLAMISGIVLMVFPYFVSDALWMSIGGGLLMLVPLASQWL